MNIDFESPTAQDAPKGKSERPWSAYVDYKSGKVQKAFAASATPDQVNAGFSYYDNEAKELVTLPRFQAVIVTVLSGVGGNIRTGEKSFDKYWSNFVRDTRSETLSVRLGFGEYQKVVAEGLYTQIKPTLPQGVNYCKWVILYLIAQKKCVAVSLSSQLENALRTTIAAGTGQRPERINLFDLFQVQGRFWGFSFSGEFVKRNSEGKPWEGEGDMFFAPVLASGIVSADKHPELSAIATSMQNEVDAYVDASQDALNKKKAENSEQQRPAPAFVPPAHNTEFRNGNAHEVPMRESFNFPDASHKPTGSMEDIGIGMGNPGDDLPF